MALIDLFFPKKCLSCGKFGQYICPECLGKVRKAYYSCPHCAKASYMGKTHPNCQPKIALSGKVCLWKYEGIIRRSILALKYKFAFDVSGELSIFSVHELKSQNFSLSSAVLVPVPLHGRRENWRGFNQAGVLGQKLAKNMLWEYEDKLVKRIKHTAPQARLSKQGRMQNISGKFAVNNELATKYRNKTIIIFDDVWTTGSTMKEIATELKKAGLEKMWGLAVAEA